MQFIYASAVAALATVVVAVPAAIPDDTGANAQSFTVADITVQKFDCTMGGAGLFDLQGGINWARQMTTVKAHTAPYGETMGSSLLPYIAPATSSGASCQSISCAYKGRISVCNASADQLQVTGTQIGYALDQLEDYCSISTDDIAAQAWMGNNWNIRVEAADC